MDIWTACRVGDLERVRQLIQDGQDVNRGDRYGTTPLIVAALYGRDQMVHELIRAGADVNGEGNDKQTALHKASWKGHSSVVKILAEEGANLNVWERTPLMVAADWGRANVVVELIRAGADVSVVSSREWSSVAAGSTALHFAAAKKKIECGVLLVEAGADMRTRNKNSKSPLDLASSRFRRTIQQAQSFSTKHTVAVIGNREHGKSTLIAALQAEGNSLLKKLTNRLTKVQDIRKRTTGIEAVQFSSQKYGETLFYDFAGQLDCHGPHQSFLEAMLSRPGVSLSLLLLVKATDEEDIITRQVTHWLQPLSLKSAPSTPQVILVGSFFDQVESREDTTKKLLRCTRSVQEQFHFNIQGPCLLDCRKPASEGIDQICTFLQEAQPLQLNSISFSYSLHWVLVQLRRSLSVPAITLHTFQSWLLKDAKLLLKKFPPAEQMCRDLTAVGHALFLPNKRDLTQGWLIVDLQAILHDVYGTLFSGSQGKVNQFGLLHCRQLTELFPKLDPAMIQEVLVSLEFCIQVDSSLMREELLKLIPNDEGDNWLYFPALVSALPLEVFPKDPHPQHLQWACWQLRAAGKHFISAHLRQTIILRLAANHVFTHELSPSVREHCCSFWVNGLSWRSTKGVDVAVRISNSSVVQVVGRTEAGPEKLYQYMSTIVSDVIKTTAQLSPKLEATSYIVHPYTPAMWEGAKAPPPDSLYPVSSIIRCISDGGDHVLSLPRQAGCLPHQTSLAELFGGWSPPLSVVQDMDFKKMPQEVHTAPLSSVPPLVPSSPSSQSGAPTVAEAKPTVPQDGEGPGQVPTPRGLSPSASASGAAQTNGQAGVTALQVLDEFRDQFIQDMDSNAVVLDLLHHDIITEGDQRTITMTMDRTQQNKFLHLYLKEKCTENAFHRVCDIISGVKGNPKMSSLGTAMKQRLETGDTVSPSALGEPHTTTQHTVTGAHTPISIDSHPTLEDINKFIVCEVPSSATISSAPTTDGKQLPSVTMSKTHPDTPLVPIAKEGGAATLHHDDTIPPTSAGDTVSPSALGEPHTTTQHTVTDTPTHFSIDSTPSFQAIRKFIVREVASDWSLVAIYLGLESSVIRMAKTDHPQQCEHACADIFERWLSWEAGTGERERTWHTVLSVVEEAGHKAFINRLKAERFNLH